MTAPLLDRVAAIEAVLVEYPERLPLHGASAAIADLMEIEAQAVAEAALAADESARKDRVSRTTGGARAELDREVDADLATHEKDEPQLARFRFLHLSEPARGIACGFADLAMQITDAMPQSDRRTLALFELVRASDAAILAVLR